MALARFLGAEPCARSIGVQRAPLQEGNAGTRSLDAFYSHWRYREEVMLRGVCLLAWLLLGACGPPPALGADPLEPVRAFCQADGRGDRLLARSWPSVAPLVSWALEPAWDRVTLIAGYEMAPARMEGEEVLVEVTYTVSAEVSPGDVARAERREQRTFRLALDDTETHWLILGPPPRPHVFESQVDADAMAASLDPRQDGFLSASAFIWRLLNDVDSTVPYLPTTQLATGGPFVSVSAPEPGDLVVYYDADEPYHVGVIEEEDVVVSATLNAGIRRAPLAAFAGTPRYRRVAAVNETPAAPATRVTPGAAKDRTQPGKVSIAPVPAPTTRQEHSDTTRRATQNTPAR